METNKISTNNQNINVAKTELESMGSGLHEQTPFEMKRKEMLIQYAVNLKENNNNWLSRLMLPKEDKMLLKKVAEKQTEATDIVLSSQNASLKAICDGQAAFTKEVINTLLTTGRSGMQGAAAVIYRENCLSMQMRLTSLSSDFATLVERKLADAKNRVEFVQDMLLDEVKLMIDKWKQDFIKIQDDFSNILAEKV